MATALGLVAGVCAGYLVQAGRAPTEPPPLAGSVPTRSGADGAEPLSAAQDRRVGTDGDLRKLLLRRPSGATEAEWLTGTDGWLDLGAYAGNADNPGWVFGDLTDQEFRRAAVTGWETDDGTVEVQLVQFRQEESVAAADFGSGSQLHFGDGVKSLPIPGTGDGRVYWDTRPSPVPGDWPYSAEAHAWRGDIAMEIWVCSDEPISGKTVLELAERQMERL
ncbi:hypothetical protein [Streptomyces sp. CRN 30]|uniref:hypothetical protein n=1 Tax=Streptomyces sp. CRN 30 TaxID=3075613 RepID=UPI002A802B5B|nr:hypothetical protein [Streptomyces sp. CRN 30]